MSPQPLRFSPASMRDAIHYHTRRQVRLFSSSTTNNTNESPTTLSMHYPRAAVSVAVRCEYESEPHYLLVQRGKEPNQGRWSFPGGKLELGETALQGGKRELAEETQFLEPVDLQWHPDTIATQDSILYSEDGTTTTQFHFLIAICFAQLVNVTTSSLPKVTPADDAADAQWWKAQDLVGVNVTPGLMERIQRIEFLYQRGVLL